VATGEPRADIRDALGVPDWTNSGFSGTIPASALSQVEGGDQTLNVYLHTPNKGWWFKSAVVTIPSTVGLQFPNDPVVFFVQPQQNQNVDQFAQSNSKFSLRGVALDRNPVTDPATQSAGAEGTGVGAGASPAASSWACSATSSAPGTAPSSSRRSVRTWS
jgi:hypothetical protein